MRKKYRTNFRRFTITTKLSEKSIRKYISKIYIIGQKFDASCSCSTYSQFEITWSVLQTKIQFFCVKLYVNSLQMTNLQILELQDVGSRRQSMESLTGGDGKHLHPGHQYNHRRSPSLRYVSIAQSHFSWKLPTTISDIISFHFSIVCTAGERDHRWFERQARANGITCIHITISVSPTRYQMLSKSQKRNVLTIGHIEIMATVASQEVLITHH